VHPPFMERRCSECHDAAARMTPRKDLLDSCKVCHQRYFTPEAGHSPVTQRQCSQCHDPHRSAQLSLLKKATYDLCIQCHDEPALLSPESHSAPDVNKCTSCHDPHFGSGKLLKNGVGKSPK
jgi:predicted CXXCH cytochrome family protein